MKTLLKILRESATVHLLLLLTAVGLGCYVIARIVMELVFLALTSLFVIPLA